MSSLKIWLVASLTLLTLACGGLGQFGIGATREPSPTPVIWPLSSFIPPQKSVQAAVGQTLTIESYHTSPAELTEINIWINDQPLSASEDNPQQATFPENLATVRVQAQEGLVQASRVVPQMPASGRTVSIIWQGHVPGVYELKMVAKDAAGRTGQPIVQRIEVK